MELLLLVVTKRRYMLVIPGPNKPTHIEYRATPRNELYPPFDKCGNAMAVRACGMHVYKPEAYTILSINRRLPPTACIGWSYGASIL